MDQFACRCKSQKKPAKVTHVIFDLDGTMLDTQEHHLEALKSTCSAYGMEYDPKLNIEVIGVPTKKVVEITVKALNIPATLEEFEVKYRSIVLTLVENPVVLPGVEKLVKYFHKNNIPMAIATSTIEATFKVKMANHEDILKMFSHYVTSTDPAVKRGKPFPDIFLTACSRFSEKPAPENCLVFEDALTGISGAKAAGMRAVMVPHKSIPRNLCSQADLVLDSLVDFKPEVFELPPYN